MHCFTRRGFTLIEIVIVVAILAAIVGAGAIFGLDSYNRSLCRAEQGSIVALLQNARSKSLNYENKLAHGLHFAPEEYVLFQGNFYNENDPMNESTPHASAVNVSAHADIIFAPLTGMVGDFMIGDIVIGGEAGGGSGGNFPCQEIISLNHEGGILW